MEEEKELIKIQKENQEILKKIERKIDSISNYFFWQKIYGILKLLIFIFIILGIIIYLPKIIDITLNKIKEFFPFYDENLLKDQIKNFNNFR